MYTTIADFEKDWLQIMGGSAKVMDALTDASLKQAVGEGYRTLGQLAWHITTSISEMANRTGLDLTSVDEKAPVPASAKEIADSYKKASQELLQQVKTKWSDNDLKTLVDMYGEKWPNGMTLGILMTHEIHHRGQMTVLMRQAGLKVPGVVGPAKEDWAAYGMQPPEI